MKKIVSCLVILVAMICLEASFSFAQAGENMCPIATEQNLPWDSEYQDQVKAYLISFSQQENKAASAEKQIVAQAEVFSQPRLIYKPQAFPKPELMNAEPAVLLPSPELIGQPQVIDRDKLYEIYQRNMQENLQPEKKPESKPQPKPQLQEPVNSELRPEPVVAEVSVVKPEEKKNEKALTAINLEEDQEEESEDLGKAKTKEPPEIKVKTHEVVTKDLEHEKPVTLAQVKVGHKQKLSAPVSKEIHPALPPQVATNDAQAATDESEKEQVWGQGQAGQKSSDDILAQQVPPAITETSPNPNGSGGQKTAHIFFGLALVLIIAIAGSFFFSDKTKRRRTKVDADAQEKRDLNPKSQHMTANVPLIEYYVGIDREFSCFVVITGDFTQFFRATLGITNENLGQIGDFLIKNFLQSLEDVAFEIPPLIKEAVDELSPDHRLFLNSLLKSLLAKQQNYCNT